MRSSVRIVAFAVAVVIGIVSGTLKSHRRHQQSASGRDDIISVKEDDPRLKAAEAEAKRRWPEFVAAFTKRKPGQTYMVKAKFTQGAEVEWMWVEVSQIQANSVRGKVMDTPELVTDVKTDEIVTKSLNDVDDWAYEDGGQLIGSFTGKALIQIEKDRKRRR